MSHRRRTFNPKKSPRYGLPTLLPNELIKFSPKWCYTCLQHFPFQGSHLRPRIYTLVLSIDGGCRPNDRADPNAKAAFAVYLGPNSPDNHAALLDPGEVQTSNRAELGAAIAALRIVGRKRREGEFETVREVILMTDSEYVARSMSSWVWNWERNGWTKSGGGSVENAELQMRLHGLVTALKGSGVSVRFWRVRREWNEEADRMVGRCWMGWCESERWE
jgi:ribonuclease HI